MTQQAPVSLALIGAGNRGRGIFGQFALDMPHRATFTAVVEPDPDRRQAFAEQHDIPANHCFADIDTFFAQPKEADAVVIATHESERENPILQAIDTGYHILVEKPLGCSPEEVIRICDAAAAYDGVFIVCHQMRYTASYATIKQLIDTGDYGDIVSIQHSENLSWSHMAHSFVRGYFNNDKLTPMIISKSCHDMDILRYLVGAPPRRLASFGSLRHFRPENAPEGATDFCLQGCPAHRTCPYHVHKIYFGDDTDPAYLRQMGVVKDKQHLRELLSHNRFGRCVYKCDNNVVDHQVVQIDFANDVTASFSMIGHNYHERRLTKISLTNGELVYNHHSRVLEASTYEPNLRRELFPDLRGTHGGGDRIILDAFVDAVATGQREHLLTPVEMSLDSHLLGFAAEHARLSGTVVDLAQYEAERREAAQQQA